MGALLAAASAGAHTPHDPVNFVALSDSFRSDGTGFVIVHNELKRTTDGGATWHRIERGLSSHGRYTGFVISPRFSVDRTALALRVGDGLFVTRDAGENWQAVDSVVPPGEHTQLVAGRVQPGEEALFALLENTGRLSVSTDGARSWSTIDTAAVDPRSLAVASSLDGRVAVVIARGGGALTYSPDGGRRWASLDSGPDGSPLVHVGFLSTAPDRVIGVRADGSVVRWVPECGAGPGCRSGTAEVLHRLEREVTAALLIPSSDPGSVAARLVVATGEGEVHAGPLDNAWVPAAIGSVPYERQAERFEIPQIRTFAAMQDGGLCAGAFGGLFCQSSADEALTEWRTIDPLEITDLGCSADPDRDVLAVATFNGGGWVSNDGGRSWSVLPGNPGTKHFWAVTWPSAGCGIEGPVFVGNRAVYWLPRSAGQWRSSAPPRRAPGLMESAWNKARRAFGLPAQPWKTSKFFGVVANAGVMPGDCMVHFGTRYEGIWSWQPEQDQWRHHGPVDRPTRVASVVRGDAGEPAAAALLGRGVWAYEGDKRWSPLARGLPENVARFEPWGAFKAHQLVRVGDGQSVYVFATDRGLFESEAGRDWSAPVAIVPSRPGLPVDALARVESAGGRDALLVSVRGEGLFRRTTGEPDFEPVFDTAGDAVIGVRWIVASPRVRESGVVYAAAPEGVFRSTDHGHSWVKVGRPGR